MLQISVPLYRQKGISYRTGIFACIFGRHKQWQCGDKRNDDFLSTIFHIDLGDYYASYIAMKERKDRTAYLHHLIDSLIKRMNEDDMKC